MLYTSYFAKIRKMPSTFHPISIAQFPPKGVDIPSCKALAPSKKVLFDYKDSVSMDGSEEGRRLAEERYVKAYGEQVLSLGKERILKEIQESLPDYLKEIFEKTGGPFWENQSEHLVLCCFEKSGDFCHRNLLAEALCKEGVAVRETADQDFEEEKRRLEDISQMYQEIIER